MANKKINIIISGYGRMGREIELIAQNQNHKIVATLDSAKDWEILNENQLKDAVIIDFSQPDVIVENIRRAFSLKTPIITGTTGWDKHREEIRKECIQTKNTLFFASNFSIGMNLFFLLNKTFAHLTKDHSDYKPQIEEIHHIHKLDKPSGTGISLAEQILKINTNYSGWISDKKEDGKISITSIRKGEVPGTHRIIYSGPSDQMEIIHTAKNRSGFALGAVEAARWIQGKIGYFEMEDMLREQMAESINLF